MRIVKSFTFDASHQLVGHKGKCANLHGHTYKLEVAVSGELISNGSSEGMVVDFTDLKNSVQVILDRFDHAVILRGDEPIFRSVDTKRVIFCNRTIAELMAKFIGMSLATIYKVDFVRLWETPTGYAEYTPEVLGSSSRNLFRTDFNGLHFINGNGRIETLDQFLGALAYA